MTEASFSTDRAQTRRSRKSPRGPVRRVSRRGFPACSHRTKGKNRPQPQKTCLRPYDFSYVGYDGNVRPCCFPLLYLGSIAETEFRDHLELAGIPGPPAKLRRGEAARILPDVPFGNLYARGQREMPYLLPEGVTASAGPFADSPIGLSAYRGCRYDRGGVSQ